MKLHFYKNHQVGHTLLEWRTVFWVSLAVFLATNSVYCCFGNGEEQRWNDPNKLRDDKVEAKYGSAKMEVEAKSETLSREGSTKENKDSSEKNPT
ncbi:hypothetical protein JTB14_015577 [Gonioctena quinquepunctata]|nr:hypothetical protein JTB14_015577 [Gonioctena quinquepunctata]